MDETALMSGIDASFSDAAAADEAEAAAAASSASPPQQQKAPSVQRAAEAPAKTRMSRGDTNGSAIDGAPSASQRVSTEPRHQRPQKSRQTQKQSTDDGIILESIVWKRRSGFGQLSGTVGVGSSWERRLLILHAVDPREAGKQLGKGKQLGRECKLRYYTLPSSKQSVLAVESSPQKPTSQLPTLPLPRGTLNLNGERVTICATHHHSDGQQPTPFCLALKTGDPNGISPDIVKWKFCFDDRATQLMWLVALNQVVVECAVGSYNEKVIAGESGVDWLGLVGEEHGGFHRMYEEGVGLGMVEVVREALTGGDGEEEELQEQPQPQQIESRAVPYRPMESFQDMTADGAATTPARDESTASGVDISPNPRSPTANIPAEGLYLPKDRLWHALGAVNLSVLYAHLTAASSTSFLVIPWWQALLAVNICIYVCLMAPLTSNSKGGSNDEKGNDDEKSVRFEREISEPATTTTTTAQRQQQQQQQQQVSKSKGPMSPSIRDMSKSAIGAELLRGEEVPLSDMPMELKIHDSSAAEKQQQQQQQHRTEPLSEGEMEAHRHERWALSAPHVNLSGDWTLVASDDFKAEYDTYLKDLGFNRITRGVACSLVGRTSEVTRQLDGGRRLYLRGTNPKGAWERTLAASGYPDFETHDAVTRAGTDFCHRKSCIKTADAEEVDAEAWWEERGTVHRSWLRGGKKYGGGDHESRRYLERGGSILVCESIFHPTDRSKKKARVTWRFRRNETEAETVHI